MASVSLFILLSSLILLLQWHLSSSADESKQKQSLFDQLLTGDGSAITTAGGQSVTLSPETLNALLQQMNAPVKEQVLGEESTRNHRGPSRRKLLYDLSVKAHYGNLVKQNGAGGSNNVADGEPSVEEKCVYFNEGLNSISAEDIKKNQHINTWLHEQLSYWTLKLCHRQSIRQVHLVPVKLTARSEEKIVLIDLPSDSVVSKDIQFWQTDEVNLGTYDFSATKEKIQSEWGQNEQDMFKPTTEYYFGGLPCQYKPDGFKNMMTKVRRSKIVYEEQCCEHEKRNIDQFFRQRNDFMILSVTEPFVCQYVVKACKICGKQSTINTPQISLEDFPSVGPSGFMHLMQTYLHHNIPEAFEVSEHRNHYDPPAAFPPMPPSQIEANKQLLRKMFTHAYDSYMYNAFPASELKPLTCSQGTFDLVRIPALTLIDTLDTLILMRNFTEFARSVERIRYLDTKMKRDYKHKRNNRKDEKGGLFSVDQNVSLFETTIRVLGGLLSAHQLAVAFINDVVAKSDVWDSSGDILWGYEDKRPNESNDKKVRIETLDDVLLSLSQSRSCIPRKEFSNLAAPDNEECWNYDGLFLTLAHDIGKRLVFAFETDTGIPFGTVNLLRGVPSGETEIASLAGAGTLTLEFELLSRLTGDPSFGLSAKRATRSLWLKRTRPLDLFGKHINVKTGKWTETLSGIGSNSDSFYEYLVKHYILFPDDSDFWIMFIAAYVGVFKNSRIGDWYVDVDMSTGLRGSVKQIFESLMAFYPGMQILLGELSPASKTLSSFFLVREFLGLLPERFDFVHWKVGTGGDIHPLRPELLESAYFLHLASIGLYGSSNGPCSDSSTPQRTTSSWLYAADFALHAVNRLSWTSCGFATVNKVSHKTTGSLDFVNGLSDNSKAEQAKLNINHHNEMPSFFLSETIKYLYLLFDSDGNILHQDHDREWIFTTEAHPIHNVPSVSSNIISEQQLDYSKENQENDSDLQVYMDNIRGLLKEQLSTNKTAANGHCMIKGNCLLHSTKELHEILLNDLESAENVSIARDSDFHESFGSLKGPLFRIELPEDSTQQYGIYSSEVSNVNYAHQNLPIRGTGSNIGAKCANYHHPRLAWPLALHGHTIEYNVAHMTSASDFEHSEDHRLQTALFSVLYYGTEYYHDGIDIESTCPIKEDQSKKHVNDNRSKSKFTGAGTPSVTIPGAIRYDMGGNLGLFDVSSFSNGEGFAVRHVSTGELLEVSMFSNEMTSGSIAILVSLTTPAEESISTFFGTKNDNPIHLTKQLKSENLKKLLKDPTPDTPGESTEPDRSAIIDYDLPQKRVVVADMNSNSYTCEVTVHKDDRVFARFPCSPGFFGAAHIENLIQSGGVSVTGPLVTPPKDDSVGCIPPSEDSEMNANNFCLHNNAFNVQLVERGQCNFTEKTLNQYIKRKAAAVIVINSEPMELFCMAGDKGAETSAEGCSQMDLPPSVLITGHDGGILLDAIKYEKVDMNSITATVNMSRQIHEERTGFPIVKGVDKTLQILASKGWGTQAVHQDDSGSSSKTTDTSGWQLFITKHDVEA